MKKRHFYVRNVRIWYGILCTELYGLKKILYGICTEFFWKVCGHPGFNTSLCFICSCNQGFYRSASDPTSAPCTSPPSAPRNLTLVLLDATSLTLAWEPPRDQGGRQDTVYRWLIMKN